MDIIQQHDQWRWGGWGQGRGHWGWRHWERRGGCRIVKIQHQEWEMKKNKKSEKSLINIIKQQNQLNNTQVKII